MQKTGTKDHIETYPKKYESKYQNIVNTYK